MTEVDEFIVCVKDGQGNIDLTQPVTRCKDCVHCETRHGMFANVNSCVQWNFVTDPNGFCAWASRRNT